jgi:hypothetical protein
MRPGTPAAPQAACFNACELPAALRMVVVARGNQPAPPGGGGCDGGGAALSAAQRSEFDREGFIVMPAVLGEAAVASVGSACDRHMDEWGPRTQPDFPVNFYANRYCPLLADPSLRALATNPATLPAVTQLMRSGDLHMSQSQLTYKSDQSPRARSIAWGFTAPPHRCLRAQVQPAAQGEGAAGLSRR